MRRSRSRGGVLPRRGAADWTVRIALAVAAAWLGYLSVSRTIGLTLRAADPARAHRLAIADARVDGAYAQTLVTPEAGAARRASAEALARGAIRRDATAIAAVTTLGLAAGLRGDVAAARRLFGYAERLSRRDYRTQLWAIEDAVGRGDVAGALRHYDIALRTARDAQALLFPIVAAAITDPPVRQALVRRLADRPAWAPHFLSFAASEGSAPRATALLFADLRRARLPVNGVASAALIDRLIAGGFPEDAWAHFAAVHPGTTRGRSRNPTFRVDPGPATAFDWRLPETPGIVASLGASEAGGVLDFAATPGVGGMVVQQRQALSPGAYRFEGHGDGLDQPAGSSPYWVLTCADGRELGRVDVTNGGFAGRFDVPAGCPFPLLTLVLRPSEAMAGVAGRIDRALLTPLAQAAR